jgi:hypothetical protein
MEDIVSEQNKKFPDKLAIVEEICVLMKTLYDSKNAKGEKEDILKCWLAAEKTIRKKYDIEINKAKL